MRESAIRGYLLFTGKAGCVQCHHGPLLSDGKSYALGVPTNTAIFAEPERHITFRRFMRTIGVGNCEHLRQDIGVGCVTKIAEDQGKFRTPSLREVARTAPYMHDGSLETLEAVVAFYNKGGGMGERTSDRLKPLSLSDQEQADLVDFLKHLSSPEQGVQQETPTLPEYELRELGKF